MRLFVVGAPSLPCFEERDGVEYGLRAVLPCHRPCAVPCPVVVWIDESVVVEERFYFCWVMLVGMTRQSVAEDEEVLLDAVFRPHVDVDAVMVEDNEARFHGWFFIVVIYIVWEDFYIRVVCVCV